MSNETMGNQKTSVILSAVLVFILLVYGQWKSIIGMSIIIGYLASVITVIVYMINKIYWGSLLSNAVFGGFFGILLAYLLRNYPMSAIIGFTTAGLVMLFHDIFNKIEMEYNVTV
jgi:hypothetical protein